MKYRQSITYYLPIWCCRYCLTVTVLPQIWQAYPTFSCILLMCSLSGVGPKKALSHWSHWKFLIPSWMFAKKDKKSDYIPSRKYWGNKIESSGMSHSHMKTKGEHFFINTIFVFFSSVLYWNSRHCFKFSWNFVKIQNYGGNSKII